MRLTESPNTRRILSFDIENRPLSYWYDGETTSEITAIAWRFLDSEATHVYMLPEVSPVEMLNEFKAAWDDADIVTGHYIRRHDIPTIQAGLMEYNLPLLGVKNTCDTKMDLVKRAGQPATLAHLADMLGVEGEKYDMSQMKWRAANRLTDQDALAYAFKRVTSDVELQIKVREELLLRGWLKTPSKWYPVTGGTIYRVD